MEKVQALVAGRRKALKLSAAEVAKKAGITAQTVRAIESGSNPPKLDTLASICKAMGYIVTLEFRVNGAAQGKARRITL